LQYITKTVNFADFEMFVNPSVLIPRPETEEWVLLLLDICKKQGFLPTAILDVCTGSGCIANTLALHFPQASVEGWDISKEALLVGKENAQRLGAKVNFREIDFLKEATLPDFDCKELLLVSNPPYIPTAERAFMQRNVLDYEPDVALFVPNETPLLFYERLAYLAQRLQPCLLMIEIHENFAEQVMALFSNAGFGDIKLHTDFHGKARAVWNS
jgi:release factor glutamine methyltransferase